MLCTLLSGAFRLSEGQLRITWFPRCAPESNSVRCGMCSIGGKGGRRLPHDRRQEAGGRRQKITRIVRERPNEKTRARFWAQFWFTCLLPPAVCLLFFTECTG